ncbi:hypothetical protein KRR26_20965 [Corallococcus sp. M34]|uniref:hypothetical protein n=1 Tax=Citreicoccus inhibens TaxID=2849499 RepID=UPI001C22DC3E|nr:hypothetical protein [Citreicoccus inhibens]MBU8898092.1 hypothetical protein [Citreicoccus inhibens]
MPRTARLCWTLSVLFTLGFAASAAAQESQEAQGAPPGADATSMEARIKAARIEAIKNTTGFQMALSVNGGLGAGYVYKDGTSRTGQLENLKITDAAKASLPILLEVGYRATPHLYGGAYGSYEPVFTKSNPLSCPDGFDCSTWQWRFGVEARYHFALGMFDPWVGLGVGMEFLKSRVKGDITVPVAGVGAVPAKLETHVTDRGPTFARLSFGGDLRLGRYVAAGPIFTASVGSYTVRTGTQTVTLSVPNTEPIESQVSAVKDGFHALFTMGLRIVWLPF